MVSTAEQAAMARALEIAHRGPRGVNPQVGALVLSASGEVLAEGWHEGAGSAHAEIAALARLAPEAATGATVVVTLEPCNHSGRTGPCTEALARAGVARVVFGASDPGAVSGGGAGRLRASGIDVAQYAAPQAEALIADWLFVQRTSRPRVTVKWAQSLDGRAAATDGSSQWITGAEARAHVHLERAAHDAIAVGTGTVIADNPRLTARPADESAATDPIPVVFGEREIPPSAAVLQHPRGVRRASRDLDDELRLLAADGIQSLYIEGGPTLASAFLRAGLADRITVYIAPSLIGGPRSVTGDLGVDAINQQIRLGVDRTEWLGGDLLIELTPTRSDAAPSEAPPA